MEIQNPTPLPAASPGGATSHFNSVNANSTGTIGQVAENVISANEGSNGTNTRQDETSERESRRQQAAALFGNDSIKAVVGFNKNDEGVFIEIRTNYNVGNDQDKGEVIATIPSDKLPQWLDANKTTSETPEPISVSL